MVIDTSALIAILKGEPEAADFFEAIRASKVRLISSIAMLEAGMIAQSNRGEEGARQVDALVRELELREVPFDGEQSALARIAFARYGKGRHPAALNLADCAVYALSKSSGEPLLFKGDDFPRTDVVAAL